MNIGIFGITGNPPHLGHFKVLAKAAKQLDEVWVSPVFNHAFGKKFLDYDVRTSMIEGMLNDLPVSNVFLKHLDKEYFEKFSQTVYNYNI
jgi:nicotinate-nucleotide adenylyltransferase